MYYFVLCKYINYGIYHFPLFLYFLCVCGLFCFVLFVFFLVLICFFSGAVEIPSFQEDVSFPQDRLAAVFLFSSVVN